MKPKCVVVDSSQSPYSLLKPVSVDSVKLKDGFWAPRIKTLIEVTLPTQYELLEETGRIDNFRRTAGKMETEFKGLFFNDSDVYKWVEAASYALAYDGDSRIERIVNSVITDIVDAQDPDGYLNTYFTFERRAQRWTNLRDMHELYCAGHLIQAAVAHYRATGRRTLLDAGVKLADHILSIFAPGKRQGTPGHPEIEMALVELYRTTRRSAFLDLAKSFIDNRGKGLIGGSLYHIDHKPFRELDEIVGHAVRSVYLNCGAADVYMETGDGSLLRALERLWQNMVNCKMYVTGGLGSRYEGEAFGENYELPNRRAYAETCAAVANVMWNWRMLLVTGKAEYADIMELALYNGALAGIGLDGETYFYVNPLVDRGLHRRSRWFDCACCPPNIARLIASISGYFYSTSRDGIWIHIYATSEASIEFNGGL
ncbi:glycoside hydrolase family 127 protein, partial [Candidatus Bathyarchaeota archaeon]|nr:glycoside hydrolase family 127 protein [Candidatus Bathyarchaeota archaeon]